MCCWPNYGTQEMFELLPFGVTRLVVSLLDVPSIKALLLADHTLRGKAVIVCDSYELLKKPVFFNVPNVRRLLISAVMRQYAGGVHGFKNSDTIRLYEITSVDLEHTELIRLLEGERFIHVLRTKDNAGPLDTMCVCDICSIGKSPPLHSFPCLTAPTSKRLTLTPTASVHAYLSNHSTVYKSDFVFSFPNVVHKPRTTSPSFTSPWVPFLPRGFRKPGLTRSRMGCLTCRGRKKRCCGSRPICLECSRLGLQCYWPPSGMENKNSKRGGKSGNLNHLYFHPVYGYMKRLRGLVEDRIGFDLDRDEPDRSATERDSGEIGGGGLTGFLKPDNGKVLEFQISDKWLPSSEKEPIKGL